MAGPGKPYSSYLENAPPGPTPGAGNNDAVPGAANDPAATAFPPKPVHPPAPAEIAEASATMLPPQTGAPATKQWESKAAFDQTIKPPTATAPAMAPSPRVQQQHLTV